MPENVATSIPLTGRAAHRKTIHAYVKETFKQGNCKAHGYQGDQDLCTCGRTREWAGHNQNQGNIDKKDTFLRERHLTKTATTDYGDICFQGFGFGGETFNKPYIRIHKDTKPEHLWLYIRDYWKVPTPKLIISVTGGAKFFSMKPRLISTFKRGLINAATTTDAWIITGGSNAGVMQFVGEAVREHQLTQGASSKKVVALGIATWGIVDNKERLEVKGLEANVKHGQISQGRFPAYYRNADLSEKDIKNVSPLDPNHSHFILVDDGTERKFGVEINLRSKLEKHISQNKLKNTEINVPVVTLVLEGGENTVETAAQAVQNATPVVIIEGSGRAADVISQAYWTSKGADEESVFKPDFDKEIRTNSKEIMGIVKEETLTKMVENIRLLLKDRNLITVFRMGDEEGSSNSMDKAILHSLLKANRSSPISQLRLALAWDCSDIARTELFRPENRKTWKNSKDLYEVMEPALVQNRAEFVQLFLDNGVDLGTFLTRRTLEELYKKVVTDKSAEAAARLIKDLIDLRSKQIPEDSILKTVNIVLDHLTGGAPAHYYNDIESDDLTKTISKSNEYLHPERELFVWAVLLNRRDLALLFWKNGKDHIGGALSASYVLQALVHQADKREELDLSQDLQTHAEEFESLAVGVLNECYKRDKDMSHDLLTRELEIWGNETVLTLSEGAELMDFMEHSCVQTKLNKIWMGKMALYNSTWKILLGLFLPFMVLFLKFTSNDINGDTLNSVSPQSDGLWDSQPAEDEDEGNIKSMKKLYTVTLCAGCTGVESKINFFKALYFYYTTPFVKFCYHTISYLVFLGLFSYVLLIDLDVGTPKVIECIVWGWAITLIIDEIRQGYHVGNPFRKNISEYFGNLWNRFDAIIYGMLIVSVILRFTVDGDDFVWARMMYALTLALFYLRFMQVFFVEKNIGPKVIMIRRMITDLAFFLLILVTVIFAYGVAQQALLYPNSTPSWEVLRGVVAQPYWNIYGELFLEDLQGDIDDCSDNATIYENDPDIPRCPENSWLAIVLNAIYMLLTNVLLLNLLIAMFSYTFERVQSNSEKVWRFFRYGLVYEYLDKPTLAPPLIIFSHLWRLGEYLHFCCGNTKHKENDFQRRCNSDENQSLTAFERVGMEHLLILRHILDRENIDSKVTSTKERIEKVIDDLQNLRENVNQKQPLIIEGAPPTQQQKQHSSKSQSNSDLETKMKKMQETLEKIEKKLGI